MHKAPGPDRSDESNGNPRARDEVVASSGISIRFWRLYAQAWLVCLLFPIVFLVQASLTPRQLLIAVTGLIIFVTIYTWFMWPHPLNSVVRAHSESHRSAILFAGLIVLALGLSLIYGSAFLWLFVGVSAVAGVALSARNAFIMVMALTLLTLGLSIWVNGGLANTDWFYVIPLVLLVRGLGLDIVVLTRLSSALRELHLARTELARHAVMEERLRLARDLHDLLGRTLSLIVLKSELAGRLIDKDPGRAAQEIYEVEHAARQALREVREAVAGYRQPTLLTELDGARQMLEAAGIQCTIENDSKALPPSIDAVLAWTVREGVTNVIRHSRASQCAIQVSRERGSAHVNVINDGYRAGEDNSTKGSGLSGLTERVLAHGGQIGAGPLPSDSHLIFRLWVELPIRPEEAVEEERSR
ncbi:two-component system, NarL family, sensor histidine kinase DesK [Thermoflexales bacterium]|nr:two-component system, NarL family, sensor histidine kinase DesK [Thermoflexales bacterium]